MGSNVRHQPARPNRIEEKRIEEKKTKSDDLVMKALNKIEEKYKETFPKKEGKKKGLEYFRALMKKQPKAGLQPLLEGILESIGVYAEHHRKVGTEVKFTKQFSAFARCYEDYLEPDFQKQSNEAKTKGATGFDAIDVSDLSFGDDSAPF